MDSTSLPVGSTEKKTSRTVKVAVVGSGLAGLSTAYYLASLQGSVIYEVHIFDENERVGFDSSSVTVTDSNGEEKRVDVPMRSFAGGYYQRVIQLYNSLGLEFHDAKFSYSFSEITDQQLGRARTYFLHGGRAGLLRKGGCPKDVNLFSHIITLLLVAILYIYFTMVTSFFGSKDNISYNKDDIRVQITEDSHVERLSSINDYGSMKDGTPVLPGSANSSKSSFVCSSSFTGSVSSHVEMKKIDQIYSDSKIESLNHYFRRFHMPSWFVTRFVVPLFAAISTCDLTTVLSSPAADVVDYKRCTFGKPHYLLNKNSKSAVAALTAPLNKENIHLGRRILSMSRNGHTWNLTTSDNVYSGFIHVVLTTSPSAISSIYPRFSEIFQDIQSNLVRVLVHTDDRVLNFMNKNDIRDINVLRIGNTTESTHVLAPGVYQTTNPVSLGCRKEGRDYGRRISPDSIVSESTFERVVRTNGLVRAVEKVRLFQGEHNVWLAGSWLWQGLVLLEGCVTTAQEVVEGIRARSADAGPLNSA
ncbi:hypothetical protein V1511DRAFT_169985 [Dipodascopsis uninucleata]